MSYYPAPTNCLADGFGIYTRSVVIAIQPYYVFLIIAHLMGWNIPENKTIELRKSFPQDLTWDRVAHIYCSKNRKSFNRIPAEYQPLMERFLGKVIGEFVCNKVNKYSAIEVLPVSVYVLTEYELKGMCLTNEEVNTYGAKKPLYGWYISDLKIYDTPKELGEFYRNAKYYCGDYVNSEYCKICSDDCKYHKDEFFRALDRPPQSWFYVEVL